MSDEYGDARQADESLDEEGAQRLAFRKLIYGLAGDEIDPTECGPVEAAARAVDRVEGLEEENEQLRQRVIDLRDKIEKMNRAAEFYQPIARKTAAKRDRQAAVVLKHAANVSGSVGREEYDSGRIQDVLEAEGELTQQGLMEETRLHQRTLRYALDRLEEEHLIDSRPNPSDARQSLYSFSR